MKRFRSTIQGIYSVSLQQMRMAELDLMRRKTALDALHRRLREASGHREQAQGVLGEVLRRAGTACILQGALGRVVQAEEAIRETRREVIDCQAELEQVQAHYLDLKKKTEGLFRLIERQRQEYRTALLKEQQHAVDEASARRWRHHAETSCWRMSDG